MNENKQGDEKRVNKRMNDDKKETVTCKEIKRVGKKNK
jgi:hypothetical protein